LPRWLARVTGPRTYERVRGQVALLAKLKQPGAALSALLVARASVAEPFLGLRLDLDPARIAELTLKVYPHGLPPVRDHRAIYTGESNPQILDAAIRLLEMIPQTEERGFLAPLVMDEILIRLLRSPMGPRVARCSRS